MRKPFLLLLSMIMMFSMLVACGDDAPPSDAPAEAATEVADGAGTDDESVASEEESEDRQASETQDEGQTWLIMLYSDADDQILEQDMFIDLNEAELIGSTDRVHIVAQIDRFEGGFDGDGDWTSAKRFYVTQDSDLNHLGSKEIEDLGEVAMSDGQTLVDFITWAAESYPADKHVLIMSDHGGGWPGGWSDSTPGGLGQHDITLAEGLGDWLFLMELDEALDKALTQAGIEKLELIGFDACLMAFLEVFAAVSPHARYAVASQEVEPSIGWAYSAFLDQLINNPDMSGAEFATAIVDSYIDQDIRVNDDTARKKFMQDRYGILNLFFDLDEGAEALAQQLGDDVTLTAVDLQAIPNVLTGLNRFADTLQTIDQGEVAQSRAYAQAFQAVFGEEASSYIDLGHFAALVASESENSQIAEANAFLQTTLQKANLAERHGPARPGATGMSIYFPISELYGSPFTGHNSYTTVANRFASDSLWDDFLQFHYTGRSFKFDEAEVLPAPAPEAEAEIQAPGASQIEITPLTLSSEFIMIDEPLIVQTEVSGEQVANIFLFVGYYDEESDSILVIDIDYLEAPTTKEVNGVVYPDWEAEGNPIEIEFEWEPTLYTISDGVTSELALLYPEEYGVSAEDTIYSTEGIYTFANSGEQRFAQIFFNGEGQMLEIYGFAGEDGTGAPREITPLPGDEFTILEEWLSLSEEEEEDAAYEGGTLVFGEQEWGWEAESGPIGEYVIGVMAENFDGGSYEEYEIVSVASVVPQECLESDAAYNDCLEEGLISPHCVDDEGYIFEECLPTEGESVIPQECFDDEGYILDECMEQDLIPEQCIDDEGYIFEECLPTEGESLIPQECFDDEGYILDECIEQDLIPEQCVDDEGYIFEECLPTEE
ncbi:MAG: clostripain-related cysteine peptidase [Ardenticatenaceae bacterium]